MVTGGQFALCLALNEPPGAVALYVTCMFKFKFMFRRLDSRQTSLRFLALVGSLWGVLGQDTTILTMPLSTQVQIRNQ